MQLEVASVTAYELSKNFCVRIFFVKTMTVIVSNCKNYKNLLAEETYGSS